jgi:hypothetical protein
MLADRELRELVQYVSPDPVLSVYLNTDPTQGNKDAYRLRLRNLLKGVNLPADVAAVEDFFQRSYDWSGKGVAVFSSAPQSFFRTYTLPLTMPDLVHVSDRPSVRVLADLLDSYGGYGVVLVDKQGARVFSCHLGILQEQEGVVGEAVKRVKHGGASTKPGSRGGIAGMTRKVDELVERNMKDSVEFAVDFFEQMHVRRILIGGTDDNIAQFRSLLPKAWQSLVVGSFGMNMAASSAEVYEKTMQIGQEAERQRENRLIEEMITQAAKQSEAVAGLDATLDAVNADRVKTLVLMQGYQQPAYQCTHCHYLTVRPLATCPACTSKMREIKDAVDYAVGRVMRLGGDVEVIHGHPRLEEIGKIGAFVRYA